MITKTELANLDDLKTEAQSAVDLADVLSSVMGELTEWAGTLPERWAEASWGTAKLDTSINDVSEAVAALKTPDAVLEHLHAIQAELGRARVIGEAVNAAGATGNLSRFISDPATSTARRARRADATETPATGLTVAPGPDAPSNPTTLDTGANQVPVSGAVSAKPISDNGWGSDPESRVHFHDDGPFGRAIRSMGPDARMDVDGEPLADVLGVLATEVVRGQRTAQAALSAVEKLRDRIPDETSARLALDRLVADESAPQAPVPAVPDGTPAYLVRLVADLHAVPMVRRDPSKELEPLLALVDDVTAGRAVEGRRFLRDLEGLTDKRHDSLGDVGKFEIDRAIATASQALRDQLAAPRPATAPDQGDR
jgi:hypothetical protein